MTGHAIGCLPLRSSTLLLSSQLHPSSASTWPGVSLLSSQHRPSGRSQHPRRQARNPNFDFWVPPALIHRPAAAVPLTRAAYTAHSSTTCRAPPPPPWTRHHEEDEEPDEEGEPGQRAGGCTVVPPCDQSQCRISGFIRTYASSSFLAQSPCLKQQEFQTRGSIMQLHGIPSPIWAPLPYMSGIINASFSLPICTAKR
jgi:hypothetical protein